MSVHRDLAHHFGIRVDLITDVDQGDRVDVVAVHWLVFAVVVNSGGFTSFDMRTVDDWPKTVVVTSSATIADNPKLTLETT